MLPWLEFSFTPDFIKKTNDSFDFNLAESTRDREVMRENLLLIHEALKSHNIRHFLLFGTLLGAMREGGIIAGDHDVDLGIHPEDRWEFATFVSEWFLPLEDDGWKIIRLWPDLVSIQRKGEYIDFYMLGPRENSDRLYSVEYSIHESEIEKPAKIELFGESFLTVADPERYLTERYGDWRTPSDKVATT
jgi:phosphorylcholine metabolism protein LicD